MALRVAALCHDVGHLPFSHAAEKELLPKGRTHEKITAAIIRDEGMQAVWDSMKLRAEDIAKLALGPKELPNQPFSTLETILSEIIVGDAFGVDRMDYLLRDAHHVGVPYGLFDHNRRRIPERPLRAAASKRPPRQTGPRGLGDPEGPNGSGDAGYGLSPGPEAGIGGLLSQKEIAMRTRRQTKLIHEGQYAAEVELELIEDETGWAPYLSVEDAEKLDRVREALRRGDPRTASKLARVFTLTPI